MVYCVGDKETDVTRDIEPVYCYETLLNIARDSNYFDISGVCIVTTGTGPIT